jgi:hypothetical protein
MFIFSIIGIGRRSSTISNLATTICESGLLVKLATNAVVYTCPDHDQSTCPFWREKFVFPPLGTTDDNLLITQNRRCTV